MKDGVKFIVTPGAPPSIVAPMLCLDEVKVLYKDNLGYSLDDAFVAKDGLNFIATLHLHQ